MSLMHTCPNGERTRLTRTGPVGTLVGVRIECPRCGWANGAVGELTAARRVLAEWKKRAAP